MKLKQLTNNILLLVTQPAKAWRILSRMGTKSLMLREFLYPLIVLACIANFFGKILGSGSGDESIYPAVVKMAIMFFTFICTYYFVAFSVAKLSPKFVEDESGLKKTDILTGYSMVVVLLLDVCLGIFPNFRIIGWMAQFYTVKIVWDGAAVLMRIPEERRLGYTMIVSVMIIFVPVIFGRVFSLLSVNF